MKTKRFILALAVLGGVLFAAHLVNSNETYNETTTASVPKNIKKPPAG